MKTTKLLKGLIAFILLTTRAGATTFYVDGSNTTPFAPYANWSDAAADIQSAIDLATDGDLILVTNGVYSTGGRVADSPGANGGVGHAIPITNRVLINKALTVRSVHGPKATVIQGYHSNYIQTNSTGYTNFNSDVRGVYLTNNATLDGFTISGGGGVGSGSGVYCESTNCFLTNCIVCDNVCINSLGGGYYGGAGVYQGTLTSCVLSNNIVPPNPWNYSVRGGGAYKSVLYDCLVISNCTSFGGGAANSVLSNCLVIGNSAPAEYGSTMCGGGTYSSSASHCLIVGNTCGGMGGSGGGDCYGVLDNCVLSNNYATGSGGGIFRGTLSNCLVVSNKAAANGGGMYSGLSRNCTIMGNIATNSGGGTYDSTNLNGVIYYNTCNRDASSHNINAAARVTNCCTFPLRAQFAGMITNEPLFVDANAGDFRVTPESPCINAGINGFATNSTDFDGQARIVGGTVDLGAYEYQAPTSVLSYAWAQQYGLPTDGSADYLDSDSDRMNNWQEWMAGTIPTNSASLLQMLSISTNASGATVSWQSVIGKTYFLQVTTNLVEQPAFFTIRSNLSGKAGTTSYTDSTATNRDWFFYRVGVQ